MQPIPRRNAAGEVCRRPSLYTDRRYVQSVLLSFAGYAASPRIGVREGSCLNRSWALHGIRERSLLPTINP